MEKQIEDFLKFYEGKTLPSPIHEPLQFQTLVNHYRYYKLREAERALHNCYSKEEPNG